MIKIYCTYHHKDNETNTELCDKCQKLLEYARYRLSKCPHGEKKPTCGQCKIHCYKLDMRVEI